MSKNTVINAIIAPPIMVAMMLIGAKAEIMKEFVTSRRLAVMGWIAIGSIAGWVFER